MPVDVCNMATSKHKYIKSEEKTGVTVSGNSCHCFKINRHTKPSQFYASQIKEKLRNLKTLLSKHLYET
jgi:hypothetical protein